MLLITGASGNLAGATLATLRTLVSPNQIAITTTNPDSPAARKLASEGVNVRKADFNDRESMMRALEGVERMYLIPTWDDDTVRFGQHQNVIEAAKANKVKHLIFASFLNADDENIVHNQLVYGPTERALAASGIPCTILRNGLYAESLIVGFDKILDRGMVHTSAGDSAITYIARADVAVAAAHLLAKGGHENRTYTLTMEKPYSGPDVAAAMTEAFGKPIRYEPLHKDIYISYIADWWGIPNAEEFSRNVVTSFEAGAAGRYNFATRDFEAIVGKPPRDLKQFLDGVKHT